MYVVWGLKVEEQSSTDFHSMMWISGAGGGLFSRFKSDDPAPANHSVEGAEPVSFASAVPPSGGATRTVTREVRGGTSSYTKTVVTETVIGPDGQKRTVTRETVSTNQSDEMPDVSVISLSTFLLSTIQNSLEFMNTLCSYALAFFGNQWCNFLTAGMIIFYFYSHEDLFSNRRVLNMYCTLTSDALLSVDEPLWLNGIQISVQLGESSSVSAPFSLSNFSICWSTYYETPFANNVLMPV